jgi:hypothetical protein
MANDARPRSAVVTVSIVADCSVLRNQTSRPTPRDIGVRAQIGTFAGRLHPGPHDGAARCGFACMHDGRAKPLLHLRAEVLPHDRVKDQDGTRLRRATRQMAGNPLVGRRLLDSHTMRLRNSDRGTQSREPFALIGPYERLQPNCVVDEIQRRNIAPAALNAPRWTGDDAWRAVEP